MLTLRFISSSLLKLDSLECFALEGRNVSLSPVCQKKEKNQWKSRSCSLQLGLTLKCCSISRISSNTNFSTSRLSNILAIKVSFCCSERVYSEVTRRVFQTVKVETFLCSCNIFKEEETEETWVISLEIGRSRNKQLSTVLYRDFFFPTLLLKTCDDNVIVRTIGQEVRSSQFPDGHVIRNICWFLAPKLRLASATLSEQPKMAAPCVSFEWKLTHKTVYHTLGLVLVPLN